jgi:hypothetical protein
MNLVVHFFSTGEYTLPARRAGRGLVSVSVGPGRRDYCEFISFFFTVAVYCLEYHCHCVSACCESRQRQDFFLSTKKKNTTTEEEKKTLGICSLFCLLQVWFPSGGNGQNSENKRF